MASVIPKSFPLDKSNATEVAALNETIGVPTAPENVAEEVADISALNTAVPECVVVEVNVFVPEVITVPLNTLLEDIVDEVEVGIYLTSALDTGIKFASAVPKFNVEAVPKPSPVVSAPENTFVPSQINGPVPP